MKDYKINGLEIIITLDNDNIVKCSRTWAEKTMALLNTDMEDVLLMFLEDNNYLTNDEQEELDQKAKKNKVKVIAKADAPKKKTPKERVQKENPTKEKIIETLANALQNLDISNLNIENKGKIITFSMNNEDFKIDLVQKRKPKEK